MLLPLLLRPIPGDVLGLQAGRVVNVASAGFLAGNFHPSLFLNPTGAGDWEMEVTDNCGVIEHTFGLVDCCPLWHCPHTNGYARAKLANLLFTQTLQRKLDSYAYEVMLKHQLTEQSGGVAKVVRRVITASLHPGTVSTNISPLLTHSSLVCRSADDAGLVLLHSLLDNRFTPGAFIDC